MSGPDELLTVYHCPGCDVTFMAGEAELLTHESHDSGSQLCCTNCYCRLCAEDFYDYVEKGVSHYDE